MLSSPESNVTVNTTDFDIGRSEASHIHQGEVEEPIYCSCQSEYCDCGSSLGVTEAAARKVYQHLGFRQGRATLQSEGHRECALHIWGTHNLSTEEILSWLADYHPTNIEWINDASCNVLFSNANTVLRVMVDCAEAFDRRVALVAAAALARLLETQGDVDHPDGQSERSCLTTSASADDITMADPGCSQLTDQSSRHLSSETLDSIEQFSQYLPPTGRWYKALSAPPKAISLFLRFAHTSDVKLPGAERRSLYYRRYGNPNYGGVTGILSRSYRRRLRVSRNKTGTDSDESTRVAHMSSDFVEAVVMAYEDPDAIVPPISPNTFYASDKCTFFRPIVERAPPARQLVVYDNLYDPDDEESTKMSNSATTVQVGSRREAAGFSTPKSPKQPRKWPRRNRGPAPNHCPLDDHDDMYSFSPPRSDNINVIDLRETWAPELWSSSSQPFVFSGNKSERRVHQCATSDITTITLMPDPQSPTRHDSTAEDDASYRTRRLLASMSMVADMEENSANKRSLASRLGSHETRRHGNSTTSGSRPRSRNVWHRLG